MIWALIDIDETILSVSNGIDGKASSIMFQKVFGVSASEVNINHTGRTERGIITEVLNKLGLGKKEIPEEAYKAWGEAADELLNNNPPRVLSGITEFLEALFNNQKIKLELLTGNSFWRAEVKLKSVHLDNYFRNPNTNELNGAFGNMALKREELFGLIKKKAHPEDKFIVVDDSLLGAEMAKKYQLPAILVATGAATEDQLKAFSANVFSDLGENRWKEAVKIINELLI